ncbi:glutathione S-transferase [Shewanella sp. OMA3-2]|uniref:glutathione S-transferase n=1 Tax=Shewanella sp. OMA3-2 TaxID=2908650 RepID=UPI001F22F14F|nr:glutathione S-transferase [Shewanella sp. OMA3-2]UJF21257.1 glutathione S-transferase [Shewanella sp. OMA3-2]
MKLYGSYTSPFVRHCRIALMESGQDFEFIETDHASSALQSPTKRVPFLQHGETFLTDSSAILFYIRQQAGQPYLSTPAELDMFCMVNTALDSTINLFFLEKDGVDLNAVTYTQRQAARINSSIAQFEQLTLRDSAPYSDSELRLACYLDWGLFRNRINIDQCANLKSFLSGIAKYAPFASTKPPQ